MNNTRRHSPVEGLDYGGPAVIEPRPLRPETLRRHLSVGLPLRIQKHSPMFSSDGLICNTPSTAKACELTLSLLQVRFSKCVDRRRGGGIEVHAAERPSLN